MRDIVVNTLTATVSPTPASGPSDSFRRRGGGLFCAARCATSLFARPCRLGRGSIEGSHADPPPELLLCLCLALPPRSWPIPPRAPCSWRRPRWSESISGRRRHLRHGEHGARPERTAVCRGEHPGVARQHRVAARRLGRHGHRAVRLAVFCRERAGALQIDRAFRGLRALFTLHGEPLTLVARNNAGITGLADLKGKKVNVGAKGSGQRVLADLRFGPKAGAIRISRAWARSTPICSSMLFAPARSMHC